MLETNRLLIRNFVAEDTHSCFEGWGKDKKLGKYILGYPAEEKQMEVEVTGAEETKVWHDGNWLGEAVYNLLDNSVKYAPEHSKIRVVVRQDEMYTRIVVSDDGIGIPEGEENRIFQRFYRGSRVTGEPGFGLGLYISREIVRLHGGFMKAKRKEQGLEVSIFLPV